MNLKDWRERYADGKKGICDFGLNYDFYFKWLTNKIISCFCIRGAPDSINDVYVKTNLILDGKICITDFNDKIYGLIGSWGGKPDEYYIPVDFIVANPVLGSKVVHIKETNEDSQTGVLITNTQIDSLGCGEGLFGGGLYDLIHQTATLLADNIVSINCAQINSRVATFFTADSESQAIAGENILKRMYAGSPYQVFRQDLVNKFNINPIASSSSSKNLTELVELHNYIIANFFQSIGIKANNVMKREKLITAEIDTQDDFVQLSLTEILASWQKGFDEVNRLYGTEITVELNPVLLNTMVQEVEDEGQTEETTSEFPSESPVEDTEPDTEETTDEVNEDPETVPEETEPEETYKDPVEIIEEKNEVVEAIVDAINGVDEAEQEEEVNSDDEES